MSLQFLEKYEHELFIKKSISQTDEILAAWIQNLLENNYSASDLVEFVSMKVNWNVLKDRLKPILEINDIHHKNYKNSVFFAKAWECFQAYYKKFENVYTNYPSAIALFSDLCCKQIKITVETCYKMMSLFADSDYVLDLDTGLVVNAKDLTSTRYHYCTTSNSTKAVLVTASIHCEYFNFYDWVSIKKCIDESSNASNKIWFDISKDKLIKKPTSSDVIIYEKLKLRANKLHKALFHHCIMLFDILKYVDVMDFVKLHTSFLEQNVDSSEDAVVDETLENDAEDTVKRLVKQALKKSSESDAEDTVKRLVNQALKKSSESDAGEPSERDVEEILAKDLGRIDLSCSVKKKKGTSSRNSTQSENESLDNDISLDTSEDTVEEKSEKVYLDAKNDNFENSCDDEDGSETPTDNKPKRAAITPAARYKIWTDAGNPEILSKCYCCKEVVTYADFKVKQHNSQNKIFCNLCADGRKKKDKTAHPHCTHYSKSQLITRASSLIKDVWLKSGSDIPNGICYVCGNELCYNEFEAGHITALANGGSNDLSNFRPIHRNCNGDMRTENMYEYVKRKGIMGPALKDLIKTMEKKIDTMESMSESPDWRKIITEKLSARKLKSK